MNTLPLQFERYSYTFTQVERNSSTAIYEQSKGGRIMAYEAVQVRVAPAAEVFGTAYPEREVYPGPEAWGVTAWTCLSIGAARERLGKAAVTC